MADTKPRRQGEGGVGILAMPEVPKSLEVGDVVGLKSGGPGMTIRKIDEGGIDCLWFDETGHLTCGSFNAKCIVPIAGNTSWTKEA